MALNRTAKRWLIILGIPIVLVVGAGIALKLYFTSERLKAIIVPVMEDATKRSVGIEDISLSVFPTIAMDVRGLSISNREGIGFSEMPILSLQRLLLDVRIGALLKGNLEITTVMLERPKILIEITEAGLANYAKDEAVRGEEEGKRSLEGAGLLLSDVQVVNGTLQYVDRKNNSATRIDGLHQQLRAEAKPGSNEIRFESKTAIDHLSYGSVTTPLISDLRVNLNQTILYRIDSDSLIIEEGECTVQAIDLKVSGSVASASKRPVLDIVIESDKVNIAELVSLAPKEYVEKAAGLEGKGIARVKILLSGPVDDTTDADISGLISATNASMQYPQIAKPITNVNLVSDFTRTKKKQEFRLTKFSASLGDNPISATMTVVNFDDPSLTLGVNASLNLAQVKDYYPLEEGTQLSGRMKANVSIAGKVSNPAAMKSSGTMDFEGVTIRTATSTNPVQNLNGTITFNNQIIESKKIAMTLGRSDLSLAFWMRNYLSVMSEDPKAPKPTANLSLTSNRLSTADLMGEQQPTGGKPQTPTRGQEKPQSGLPLPNVDMDVTASIGTFTMEKFELSNVRATMRIANGIIAMNNLSCNAFDGSIITKGTLNMQKPERPEFDLAIDMIGLDAHAILPKFTSFGERMFGKLTMNTSMKGALNDTLGLIPQSLNSTGQVQVQNGKLTGVKVNKAVAGILNLPDLEEIQFRDWANAYTITDGRFHIRDLRIAALGADYIVNGSHGLDGTLDYRMTLLLSEKTSAKATIPGLAGQAVNFLKDESGRLKLDFTVAGSSDNPRVALDTSTLEKKAEDAAKKKLAEEAKKVEDELKKKGEELLKDLFKKKK